MGGKRTVLGLMLVALLSGACGGPQRAAAPTASADILGQAAAQATAIVEQAQATALVLQAQAQATAMVAQAEVANRTPTPASTRVVQVAAGRPAPTATPVPQEPAEQVVQGQTVEVLRVSFAAEGGLIMVQFRAPPKEAEKWWQGSVQVIDEASQQIYNEIPVMPKVGPLIGRPKLEGQLGYVMLVNALPGLRPGARVTVVLGQYRFEHVPVE